MVVVLLMLTDVAQLPGSAPFIDAVSVTWSPVQTIPVGPEILTVHCPNALLMQAAKMMRRAVSVFLIDLFLFLLLIINCL